MANSQRFGIHAFSVAAAGLRPRLAPRLMERSATDHHIEFDPGSARATWPVPLAPLGGRTSVSCAPVQAGQDPAGGVGQVWHILDRQLDIPAMNGEPPAHPWKRHGRSSRELGMGCGTAASRNRALTGASERRPVRTRAPGPLVLKAMAAQAACIRSLEFEDELRTPVNSRRIEKSHWECTA